MPQRQLVDFGQIICYTMTVNNLIYLKKCWVVFKVILMWIKTRKLVENLHHPSTWYYITKVSLRQESEFHTLFLSVCLFVCFWAHLLSVVTFILKWEYSSRVKHTQLLF